MGAIVVKNLSKAFKQYPNRWARLFEWVWPSAKPRHRIKSVLHDISFTVNPGEALGIIGINGAGKSTLLKMITGTTQPTTGTVQMTGRVAALLELGMGFHPDFTGRQNAYMAGQLLGYGAEEIAQIMPGVESFAEIGEYMDQPLRVFSSGMQVRLAFALATAVRPDVLIVDEALSVGDTYFQHKSFERIRHFREQGTTLLLVSHDSGAIQSICDRAILLNNGRIAKQGKPEEVLDFYNAMLADRESATVSQTKMADGSIQTISGTREIVISDVVMVNDLGKIVDTVLVGEVISLRVKAIAHKTIPKLVLGYMIKNRLGQAINGTNTHHLGAVQRDVLPGELVEYNITFPVNLGPGSYSVAIALTSNETHLENNYEWRDLAMVFTVVNGEKIFFGGCVWLDSSISVQRRINYANT